MPKVFDIQHPIISEHGNRSEIFLVEFDGFIKNTAEALVLYILDHYEELVWKYDSLFKYYDTFYDMTKEEIYEFTSLLPIDTFVKSALGIEEEEVDSFLNEIEDKVDVSEASFTEFELVFRKIADEDFTSQIFFYRERPFTLNQMEYIKEKYASVFEKKKIQFVHGDLNACIKGTNATTVFTSNHFYIENYVKDNQDSFKGVEFIVRNTLMNLEFSDVSQLFYPSKESDALYESISESGICQISRLQVLALREEEMNPMIWTNLSESYPEEDE